MKKAITLIGCFFIIFSYWSCQEDEFNPDIGISKLQEREVESKSLENNPLQNSSIRNIQVYTPADYSVDQNKNYPVVYLLHGLPFTEKSFISQETWEPWIGGTSPFQSYPDFPEKTFRQWIDAMIESGLIEPMIIVMPNAANNNYGFSWYSNSILNGGFEDYIVNDLVSFMDSNYRTIAKKEGRAVIGFSQGGYAAVKYGLLHADKFSVIAGHSGLLYLDGILSMGSVLVDENPGGFQGPDPAKFLTSAMYSMSAAWSPNTNNPPFMVDLPFEYPSGAVIPSVREKWMMHDAFTLLDSNMESFKSLDGIFIDCGDFDELGMTDMVKAFCLKMQAMNVEHTYETYQGGHFDHMYSRLERSLTFCSDKMN